jgi:hypothetical protein
MEEMAQKLEEKYEDKIIDLDERVHEYKNIIVNLSLFLASKRYRIYKKI